MYWSYRGIFMPVYERLSRKTLPHKGMKHMWHWIVGINHVDLTTTDRTQKKHIFNFKFNKLLLFSSCLQIDWFLRQQSMWRRLQMCWSRWWIFMRLSRIRRSQCPRLSWCSAHGEFREGEFGKKLLFKMTTWQPTRNIHLNMLRYTGGGKKI